MSYAKNLVLLDIDTYEDNDFSGRIYTRYDRDPITFASSLEMLLRLEECYDRWNFPENAVLYRSFWDRRGRTGLRAQRHRIIADRKILELPPGELPAMEGEVATVLLECQKRLHADWSGQCWLGPETEAPAKPFQSTLELLRQIDQYVASRPQKAGVLWERRRVSDANVKAI